MSFTNVPTFSRNEELSSTGILMSLDGLASQDWSHARRYSDYLTVPSSFGDNKPARGVNLALLKFTLAV
jgi:hypothetical protein